MTVCSSVGLWTPSSPSLWIGFETLALFLLILSLGSNWLKLMLDLSTLMVTTYGIQKSFASSLRKVVQPIRSNKWKWTTPSSATSQTSQRSPWSSMRWSTLWFLLDTTLKSSQGPDASGTDGSQLAMSSKKALSRQKAKDRSDEFELSSLYH